VVVQASGVIHDYRRAGTGTQEAQEAQDILRLLCFLCSVPVPDSPAAADSDSRSHDDRAAEGQVSQDLLVIPVKDVVQPDERGNRPGEIIRECCVGNGIARVSGQLIRYRIGIEVTIRPASDGACSPSRRPFSFDPGQYEVPGMCGPSDQWITRPVWKRTLTGLFDLSIQICIIGLYGQPVYTRANPRFDAASPDTADVLVFGSEVRITDELNPILNSIVEPRQVRRQPVIQERLLDSGFPTARSFRRQIQISKEKGARAEIFCI